MANFEDKIILVTGAARGIGFATAEQFAREGGTVVATDLNDIDLDNAFAQLREEGFVVETAVQDVSKRDDWKATIGSIQTRHGGLDVLVNNAGGGQFVGIEETTIEQWRHVLALNLDSVFFGVQEGIAAMKERGGAIVNVASIAANVAEPLLAAYSATKGGVMMLTKTSAVDCARRGYNIRINSIHPGFTNTNLVKQALASLGDQAEAFAAAAMVRVPMGRLAEPVEIARPILFLASSDASFMTGASLIVDGGYTVA